MIIKILVSSILMIIYFVDIFDNYLTLEKMLKNILKYAQLSKLKVQINDLDDSIRGVYQKINCLMNT
jgi:hypothetical protein